MAGDVAQLGLSVTSKGVDEATQSLNALASAAQNAEQSTSNLGNTSQGASEAAGAIADAGNKATNSLEMVSTAAEDTQNVFARTFANIKQFASGFKEGFSESFQQAMDETKQAAPAMDALSSAALTVAEAITIVSEADNNLTVAQKNATAAVEALAAAQRDTTSPEKLAAAQKEAAASVIALTEAQKASAAANNLLTSSQKQLSEETDTLSKAHGALSTQAMSAFHSVRSMTEGLAMGMPVTTVLAQQINHLSYAASGPGGLKAAFGDVLGSFTKMLSPALLIGGAFTAIAAGSLLAIRSLVNTEKAFDDLARTTNTTIGLMHSLAEAASFKGIGEGEFTQGMEKFAQQVSLAQHNMGELRETLMANGQSANSFTEYLQKAAELIRQSATDQQRLQMLQSMGLPATMDWVRFLSQGKDAIQAAVAEANHFDDAASKAMVEKSRAFEESWNRAWSNFKTWARSATMDVATWLGDITDKANNLGSAGLVMVGVSQKQQGLNLLKTGSGVGGKAYNLSGGGGQFDTLGPTTSASPGGGKGGDTQTAQQWQQKLSAAQQYISLLGPMATAADRVRAVELQLAEAGKSGAGVSKQQAEALKQLAYESALGITSMKEQADAEKVQAATLGMSAGEAAKYTAVQTQINDAKRNSRQLTLQNIADIEKEAEALGKATQAATQAKFAFDQIQQIKQQINSTNVSALTYGMGAGAAAAYTAETNALNEAARQHITLSAQQTAAIKAEANALGQAAQTAENMKFVFDNLVQGPMTTFASQIAQGAKAMDALKQAGLNALNAIAQQLMKMAANNLWQAAFGGAGGGGGIFSGLGSLFGGVHHGGYGPGDSFKTRAVDPAVFTHAPRFHSGIGAGERAAVIRNDESVLTPGQMKQLAPVGQQGGQQGIKADIGVSVDDDGKLMAVVKNVTKQMIGDFAGSPQFVNHVASATKTARTQRKL